MLCTKYKFSEMDRQGPSTHPSMHEQKERMEEEGEKGIA